MALVAKNFQDIITFSRATQTGTYVNSSGYITNSSVLNYLTYSNQPENAAWTKNNSFVQQNLLTYSEDFTNAVWATANTTITANQTIAPNGTLTADKIEAAAGAGAGWQTYQALTNIGSGAYCYSIYALQGSGANDANSFYVSNATTVTIYAALTVNYATGVVTQTTGTGATATSVGGGWWRIVIPFTSTATLGNSVRFNVANAGTVGVPGVYMYAWGAQLVQGSVPGDYRATTSAALPCLYADYNGALRARKLCEDAAAASHLCYETIATVSGNIYTSTIKIKAAERGFAQLRYENSGSTQLWAANVNLTDGTYTTTTFGSPTITSASITSQGNGWWLVSVSASSNNTQWKLIVFTQLSLGVNSYTGDGSSGIYIADAQLNDGSSALAYYDTTQYAYNAPRFDYDPVTLAAKGLLVEESRANLLLYSNDFSNAAWTKTTLTVTAASALSPEGSVNASLLTNTALSGRITQSATATATSHSYSAFTKAGTASTATYLLYNQTTATVIAQGDINLTTGVVSVGIGTMVSVSAANGWYRATITATTGITIGNTLIVYIYPGGSSGAIGATIYAYGAQLEAGAFATSYIPTVGSQVTRAADLAVLNTLSPWFNSAASTVYIELQAMWTTGGTGNDRSAWSVSGGTNPLLGVVRGSGGSIQFHDETAYRVMPNGTYSDGSIRKVAIALADPALTANAAINGTSGSVITDGSTLDAGTTAFNLGASTAPGNFWCGWIRRFTYYPRQMTLADCATLTTL